MVNAWMLIGASICLQQQQRDPCSRDPIIVDPGLVLPHMPCLSSSLDLLGREQAGGLLDPAAHCLLHGRQDQRCRNGPAALVSLSQAACNGDFIESDD